MTGRRTAKYLQVATVLDARIRRGELKPDTPLPTIRELMAEFRFSLATVTRAIEIIERRGLITRIHGKGIFVNGPMFPRSRARAPRAAEASPPPLSIGVLCNCPNPDRPAEMWWSRILRGVDAALAAGSVENACLRIVQVNHRSPEEVLRKCADDGMEAVLLLGGDWEGPRAASLYGAVRQYRLPAVMMWTGNPRPLCVNTVDVDSRSGIYAAVEYLVRLGHSRLLFLGFDDRQNWVEERRRAFREIAALLRVPHVAESALPRPVERREKDPRRTLSGATGVVAVNDDAAVWLLNAAARAGLAVPRDVSVVGFDDDPQFRHLELTTVHVDMEQLGCEAGRLLGRLAAAPFSTAISHLQFPAELVVRHTTGPAPKRRG